jgi:hypothetical protein
MTYRQLELVSSDKGKTTLTRENPCVTEHYVTYET